jgi:plastocyanin
MNKLIVILLSIIVILSLFLGFGLSRLNTVQENTDNNIGNVATIDMNSFTDKGTLNPWPHNDLDQNNINLPAASDLLSIYEQIRKSYDSRDYELFKKYASTETIWHLEHNLKQEEEVVDSQFVFSLIPATGMENFLNNNLLLPIIEAPSFNNIEASSVTWDASDYTLRSFVMIDKVKMEKYKIEGQSWNIRANLNVNIVNDNYQSGNGIIHFVYDDGVFKYHYEEWNNQFNSGANLGDQPGENDIVFTIEENEGQFSPEVVYLQQGQYVRWPIMNGFILSQNESPEHFASPFLTNSSYTKKFNVAGTYEYVIFDNLYNEIYRGKIEVE